MDTTRHEPVLLEAVVSAASGAGRIVDATVGHGGHAQALVEAGTGVALLGIDRDPDAIATARRRLDASVRLIEGVYSEPEILAQIRTFRPDFILLDLGVSSRQLDDPARGFTFRPGAPLDMRMSDGPLSDQVDAAGWLATAPPGEMQRVFSEYGDERRARGLAREIARRRMRHPLATSDDLVNAIRAVLGPRSGPGDFARLFQAVRIAVNDELTGLEQALPLLRDALVGGSLVVISYHSGEDRIVKRAFREWARACVCPPRQPICTCRGRPLGRATPRRPVVPSEDEIASNPRARSAKLRIFQVDTDR